MISSRTRFRSGRNGTVLGSKKPRQGLPFLYGPYQISNEPRALPILVLFSDCPLVCYYDLCLYRLKILERNKIIFKTIKNTTTMKKACSGNSGADAAIIMSGNPKIIAGKF